MTQSRRVSPLSEDEIEVSATSRESTKYEEPTATQPQEPPSGPVGAGKDQKTIKSITSGLKDTIKRQFSRKTEPGNNLKEGHPHQPPPAGMAARDQCCQCCQVEYTCGKWIKVLATGERGWCNTSLSPGKGLRLDCAAGKGGCQRNLDKHGVRHPPAHMIRNNPQKTGWAKVPHKSARCQFHANYPSIKYRQKDAVRYCDAKTVSEEEMRGTGEEGCVIL